MSKYKSMKLSKLNVEPRDIHNCYPTKMRDWTYKPKKFLFFVEIKAQVLPTKIDTREVSY